MTPHQLRVFISVAKHRSFTQAGRELYVSQSAISHEVNRLQKTLGATLIERSPRGMELTLTGAALRTDAVLILAQLDGLETKYGAAISKQAEKIVALGANYGATATLLPSLIARFKESNPSTKLNLYTDMSREIEALLMSAKIDIGITTSRKRLASFKMEPFRKVRLCAFVPADHPLARTKKPICGELAGISSIVTIGNGSHIRTKALLRRLRVFGLSPSTLIRCGSPDAVKMAIRNGAGMGILDYELVQDEVTRKEFALLKISGIDLTAHSYIMYSKKKPLSAPARVLLRLLREARQIRATVAATAHAPLILLSMLLMS